MLNLLGTRTSDQQANVLNGSALMHDYIVVNANKMYLFPGFNSISGTNGTGGSGGGGTGSVSKTAMTPVATATGAAGRLDAGWTIVTIVLTIVGVSVSAM